MSIGAQRQQVYLSCVSEQSEALLLKGDDAARHFHRFRLVGDRLRRLDQAHKSTVQSAGQPRDHRANPSAWSHRLPVLGLALLGCCVSVYLTLFQWHITASVWDPVFGAGSEAVLTSFLSRMLPLPDATLGAAAYLIEAVLTALGDSDRWRTRPRLVIAFGLVLASLGVTSLVLVLTQIFAVHALCSLCLCSAAISVTNAWLGRGEVFATLGWA